MNRAAPCSRVRRRRSAGVTRLQALGLLLLLLLALSAWLVLRRFETPASRAAAAEDARITRIIDNELATTKAANRAACQRHLRAGEAAVARSFARAEAGVGPAVGSLCSLRSSAGLCVLMVRDRLGGGDRAQQRIAAALQGHVLDPCLAGYRDAENTLGQLADELDGGTTGLAVRLAARLPPAAEPPSDPARPQALRGTAGKVYGASPAIGTIAASTASSEAGLAVSAVLIRSTWRSAAAVLRAVVQRLAGTQAAALTSAVADGPFPVGDAIAVLLEIGGTGWALYDLHKAQARLKGTLETDLRHQIRDTRKSLLASMRREAAARLEASNARNRAMAEELRPQPGSCSHKPRTGSPRP